MLRSDVDAFHPVKSEGGGRSTPAGSGLNRCPPVRGSKSYLGALWPGARRRGARCRTVERAYIFE
eukprot:scaffold31271_cov68-Phaeocystis_antarctica.AAC.8